MRTLIPKTLKLVMGAGMLVVFLSSTALAENLILKFIADDGVGEAWILHPASLSAYTAGMDVPYVFEDDSKRLCIGSQKERICITFDRKLEGEGSTARFTHDDGRKGTVHLVSAND